MPVLTEPGTARAARAARPYWMRWMVWAIPLGCVAALAVPIFGSEPSFGRPAFWALIALAFLIAMRAELTLELRRQTIVVILTDVATCFGLFLLPPAGLVLVHALVETTVGPMVWRRRPPHKMVFNVTLHVMEVIVAAVVFSHLAEPDVTDPRSWWALAVAIIALNLSSSVVVVTAVWLAEAKVPWPWPLLRRNTVQSQTVGLVSALLAVVGLLVMHVSAYGVIPLLLLLAVGGYGFRAYRRFLRQHGHLGEVYQFSRMLETSRADLTGLGHALGKLRTTFNATTACLYVEAADPAGRVCLIADDSGVTRRVAWVSDPLHDRLRSSGSGLLVSGKALDDAMLRHALEDRGARELLAICLRNPTRVLGFLELRDRAGQVTTFDVDDVRLLENLATHLTAALVNQQLVERLRHDATHDRLTGLPNRERLIAAVDEAIAAASGTGDLVAVLQLDIDSFKDVNDSLGHEHGDRLLGTVAERLRTEALTGSVVARMGADEFAVLLRVPDLATAEGHAAALREALCVPYPLAGLTVHVNVSVGVAAAPDHAPDGDILLRRADVALYSAKSKGRAVATYLPTMDQASVHRLRLVTQLREALRSGEVKVRYQPKIAMSNRELAGVEALVRWEHPDHGTVVPDDFVPLAERTGLIGPLTDHVLRESIAQCRAWLDRDLRIGVAVNLSVRNLLDTEFPDRVAELLAEAGVPADLLAFEITESSVMSDPERSLPVLHRLHELGVGLSIDDFGTGYSSLAYLRRLPVDEVKIDKSFVFGMGSDLGDLAVVRSIVELGHSLGLTVVAEGVEEDAARDQLANMGCDVAQGYLISRPLSEERLEAWLQARTTPNRGLSDEMVLTLLS